MIKNLLAVRETLTEKLQRVFSDQHPHADSYAAGTVFAVFGEQDGCYQGLVTEQQINRYPCRIFADLVPRPHVVPLSEDISLESLQAQLTGETTAVAVNDVADRFLGVVTRASLLDALLRWHQQARESLLKDRAQLDQWSHRLQQLNDDIHELLVLLAESTDIQRLAQCGIDRLAHLIGARYGALWLLDEAGALQALICTGISAAQVQRIGALPSGKGLLGIELAAGTVLNVPELAAVSQAAGFPLHHPEMHSLLAMPTADQGNVLGRVYLCDKHSGAAFSKDDEILLKTFANTLALVLLQAREQSRREAAQQEAQVLLQENRRLMQDLFTTLEQERRYLARELHDEMGQYCTAIQCELQAAMTLVHDLSPRIHQHCQSIAKQCDQVQAIMHALLRRLRPELLDEMGLSCALGELVAAWRRVHPDIICHIDVEDRLDDLSESLNIAIYRIVQESLNNVAQHACATRVRIHLCRQVVGDSVAGEGRVLLVVSDDGTGFSAAEQQYGLGLTGMRERALIHGGTLQIDSARQKGVKITVELPISPAVR